MAEPSTSTSRHWYIAQLKPNGLKSAQRNLERQGFGVFVPMEQRTTRHGGRFKVARFPVFPGYAFLAVDPDAGRWQAIKSTRGVARLVSFGATPARVSPQLIEALDRRYGDDGKEPPVALQPGDAVRITDGPFADFVSRVEAVSPERRVHLLIDLLGREARISVDPAHLRRTQEGG